MGEPIVVSWTNAPGNRYDWLDLYAANSSPTTGRIWLWRYVDARVFGSAAFKAEATGNWPLPPGRYRVSLCVDDGYTCLGRTESFRVMTAYASSVPSSTTITNRANASTCTTVHHRQIAWITNSSAYTSHRTNAMAVATATKRAMQIPGAGDRHAQGEQRPHIARNQARPSSATGTPSTSDWALVVTRSQLTTPVEAHASTFGEVKCAIVR